MGSLDDNDKYLGYKSHDTPTLSQVPIDAVPVYTIPNEEGYFPTGFVNNELVTTSLVQLYQIHPKYAESSEGVDFPMITEGSFSLLDPSPGTPSDIALIAKCENIILYVMNDDATIKVSQRAFNLLLPEDCIRVQLSDDISDDTLLHIEGLLAARTKFSDKSTEDSKITSTGIGENRDLVPKGRVCQSMYTMSVLMASGIVAVSKKGSKQIENYGEKKRASITEMKETKISDTTLSAASTAKSAAKSTNTVVGKISTKLSKSIGGALATKINVTEKDSKNKRRGKRYLKASALAFSEVADAVGEGYDKLSSVAKEEATAFVAAKYGREAGELCRHTVGAAMHFGKAALTARRILDVKSVIKESSKVAVAETLKT